MMEAQCAVAETAIRGAEPGLAEVKDYFTWLENKKTSRCSFTLVLKHFIFSISLIIFGRPLQNSEASE